MAGFEPRDLYVPNVGSQLAWLERFLKGMEKPLNIERLTMTLMTLAENYASRKRLSLSTLRKFRYELCIWWDWGGPLLFRNVTSASIDEFRQRGQQQLAPRTIESVISTVATLMKFAGCPVDVGERLFWRPRPPRIPTMQEFDAIIDEADGWHRLWLAVAFVTGLRLGDLERLSPRGDELIVDASKTGKRHVFPLPRPIARLCDGRSLKAPRKRLLLELRALCDLANVPHITPQTVRAFSASEWERARPGCGAVILGHALPGWTKATAYYLDPAQQLRLGLPNLRLPPSLLTPAERTEQTSRETRLLTAFRALPDDGQRVAADVVAAMVR